MPSALFLPDLGYDHRIWADIPSRLAGACDVVSLDAHVPMPWAEPDSRAFLDAVCRLVPDPPHSVVVAADTDLVWLEDRPRSVNASATCWPCCPDRNRHTATPPAGR